MGNLGGDMSSSQGKQKKAKKASTSTSESSSSSQLPSAWSQWDWNGVKGCFDRYRLNSAGNYEIEDDLGQQSNQPAAEPRSTPPLSSDSLQQNGLYQVPTNYTTSVTSSMDTLTTSMYQTSIQNTQQDSGMPSSPQHIRTRDPRSDREEFNPNYKVHQPWEFKYGRVFKVLWVEPKGMSVPGSNSGSSNASYTQRDNEDGNGKFQKVRRFIVINSMNGHCICLPINTYSRQGVTKRGVHAEHHTIVYTEKKPVYFPGEKEKGLTKKPIKIICSSPRHKLDEHSRLNYHKTYTVEYNVKVCFIGKVDKKSEWYLTADFNSAHPPLMQRGDQPLDEDETEHAEGGSSAYTYPQDLGEAWRNDGSSPSSKKPLVYNTSSFSPDRRDHYDIDEELEDGGDNDYPPRRHHSDMD
ncbi:hypothetical protein VTL71DRAFT_3782 [Oculimacula yallundae]|uniref:DUF6590 domain-containing protein n=1 Tax=Oculimacula yallundae TaxID=86028 RepID=A0ABR4C415_9HELO